MLDNFRKVDVVWNHSTNQIYQRMRVASSDDHGRKLVVQITNDHVIQDTSEVELRLYWEIRDKKGFNDFELIDAEHGIYEIYFSRGMLENKGTHKAWLHLTDSTGSVTSEAFGIEVFSGIDLEAVEGTDDFSALNSALARVVTIESQEEERQMNETAREQAESTRVAAEDTRKSAEDVREANENKRQTNENARESAETARESAESTRESNENVRESNESTRQENETKRENTFDELDTNANDLLELLDGKYTGFEDEYAPRLTEVTAQLAETETDLQKRGLDVTKFGVVGDGITDNTTALQQVLDIGGDIFFPSGVYYFKNLNISKSNTRLLFAPDVKLKSDNPTSTQWATIKIGGTLEPNISPTMDVEENTSVITLNEENISQFEVGDYIYLTQNSPSGETVEQLRQRYLDCLMQIKEIVGSTITVKGTIPHSFQVSNNFTISKANVVKNVELIGSGTVFDHMGVMEKGAFIQTDLTTGFKISGFHLTNGSNRSVYITRSNNFFVERIKTDNHLKREPGYGYGITTEMGSGWGYISDIETIGARHGIDIAGGSHNITIERVTAHETNINGHGHNSKHITVRDCTVFGNIKTGAFSVGNFKYSGDKYWKFINCKVFQSTSGYGFAVYNHSENIFIIDCETVGGSRGVYADRTSGLTIEGFDSTDNFAPVQLISVEGAKVNNVKAKDVTRGYSGSRSGIIINSGTRNVEIANSSFEGKYHTVLTIGLDEVSMDKNLRVLNSILRLDESVKSTPQTRSISSSGENCHFIGCTIDGNVFMSSPEKEVTFLNNGITGALDVRTSRQTVIVGNYGDFTITPEVPEHNGEDIIIQNNTLSWGM